MILPTPLDKCPAAGISPATACRNVGPGSFPPFTDFYWAPEWRRRGSEELGYVTIKDAPQEFAKFLHEDIEKMSRLIKQYNLEPE
jgi:hypothetical protein